MGSAILQCNVMIEYFKKDGFLLRTEHYKRCFLRLFRNKFREMFLELRGKKNKAQITQQLKNVNVYKKFLNEGKATIQFKDDRLTVLISNAPRSDLFNFMKLLTIKLIVGDEMAESARKKLLYSKPTEKDLSPVTERDMEKAKAKLNHPDKIPAGASKISKCPVREEEKVEAKKSCLMVMVQQNLEDEQKEILQAAKCGQNIFFTGGAGTGKSHVLKCIIEALPPETTFVTASTAVAACQLGGSTLHQFAGLGTGEGTIEHCINLASKPHVRAVWRKCEHLIIDEISMVHGHFFEKLEHVARVVKKSKKPFGGIQLILCGDFFQLPPVGKDIVYCFETEVWDKCVTRCFELTKVHRQTDPVFVNILENIRMGVVTKEICDQLLATANQTVEKDGILATRLCTHNSEALDTNLARLDELKGKAKIFTADDDPPSSTELMNKQIPVSSRLCLKVGAQVMLMKNISFSRGLVYGSRGVVLKFDSDGLPIVKFSSVTHKVHAEKFVMKMPDGRNLVRVQIPLNLAWAFTIHKSQGMTLDCVELSLSRVFGFGHAYVALSRVKSLDCLRVNDFKPRQVWANKRVLDYHEEFRKIIECSKFPKLL